MEKMNSQAMNLLSYGLYVLTAREGEKDNGCIVNVVQQVTDTPLQIVVTVNKKNLTHDMIVQTGLLNVSVLTEQTPMKVIEHFGFQSGRAVDKFAQCGETKRSENGLVYLPKYTNGYLSGEVKQMVDMGTHTMFVAEITEAVKLSSEASLTYGYYHAHIKGKPAVVEGDSGKARWVCQVCGYVYEGAEVPDDFECPWCKHGKADFVKEG